VKDDLFLNQGAHYPVRMHDTRSGLQTVVHDVTTAFAPKPSALCTNIPYNFHPMYSTSSRQTLTPWAATTYNAAFDTEIDHCDCCSEVTSQDGCAG
jgi:hypothetical protein